MTTEIDAAIVEVQERERAVRFAEEDRAPWWPPMRRIRADMLTSFLMQQLSGLFDEVDRLDRRADFRRRFWDRVMRTLFELGADIVTDEDRRRAGLPLRGYLGFTNEELRILEHRRIAAMTAPPFMVPKDSPFSPDVFRAAARSPGSVILTDRFGKGVKPRPPREDEPSWI